MKEYNYSDIVKVDKRGILFSDAEFMEFEDCRREWAKENNISVIALSLIIYIGLANFLNSSYLAKTNSILFMIMIGILFYSYHKTLENSRGNL